MARLVGRTVLQQRGYSPATIERFERTLEQRGLEARVEQAGGATRLTYYREGKSITEPVRSAHVEAGIIAPWSRYGYFSIRGPGGGQTQLTARETEYILPSERAPGEVRLVDVKRGIVTREIPIAAAGGPAERITSRIDSRYTPAEQALGFGRYESGLPESFTAPAVQAEAVRVIQRAPEYRLRGYESEVRAAEERFEREAGLPVSQASVMSFSPEQQERVSRAAESYSADIERIRGKYPQVSRAAETLQGRAVEIPFKDTGRAYFAPAPEPEPSPFAFTPEAAKEYIRIPESEQKIFRGISKIVAPFSPGKQEAFFYGTVGAESFVRAGGYAFGAAGEAAIPKEFKLRYQLPVLGEQFFTKRQATEALAFAGQWATFAGATQPFLKGITGVGRETVFATEVSPGKVFTAYETIGQRQGAFRATPFYEKGYVFGKDAEQFLKGASGEAKQARKLIENAARQGLLPEEAGRVIQFAGKEAVLPAEFVPKIKFPKGVSVSVKGEKLVPVETSLVVGERVTGKPSFIGVLGRPKAISALKARELEPFAYTQVTALEPLSAEKAAARFTGRKAPKARIGITGRPPYEALPAKAEQVFPTAVKDFFELREAYSKRPAFPISEIVMPKVSKIKEYIRKPFVPVQDIALQKGVTLTIEPGKVPTSMAFQQATQKGITRIIGLTEGKERVFGEIAEATKDVTKKAKAFVYPSKFLEGKTPLLEMPSYPGKFVTPTIIPKDITTMPKSVQQFFGKTIPVAQAERMATQQIELGAFLSPSQKTTTMQLAKSQEKTIKAVTGERWLVAPSAGGRTTVTIEKTVTRIKEPTMPKASIGIKPTTKEKEFQGIFAGTTMLTAEKGKVKPSELIGIESIVKQAERIGVMPVTSIREISKTRELTIPRATILPGIREAARAGERIKESEISITKTITDFFKPKPPKPPKKPIGFKFGFPIEKEFIAPKAFLQGFDVFLKKGKQFVKISRAPLERKAALGLGALATETSARTFLIKPTGFPGIKAPSLAAAFKPERFRKPYGKTRLPGIAFVEKTKYAIDMPKELEEITYKGLKARKAPSILALFGKKKKSRKTKRRKQK